jgi:hypothetical protein
MAAAAAIVPPDKPTHPSLRGPLDMIGAASVTVAFLAFVRAVVRAPTIGRGATDTIGAFAIAVAFWPCSWWWRAARSTCLCA